jgi:hypothetical protein
MGCHTSSNLFNFMAAYCFGHSLCNPGRFPFKMFYNYVYLRGVNCSRSNWLKPIFLGLLLLVFIGFFISESEKSNYWFQKNWLESGFFPVAATGL